MGQVVQLFHIVHGVIVSAQANVIGNRMSQFRADPPMKIVRQACLTEGIAHPRRWAITTWDLP